MFLHATYAMYACMYVCMYVVCMYVYVCICMYMYVYVCICMYMYACMYVCMYVSGGHTVATELPTSMGIKQSSSLMLAMYVSGFTFWKYWFRRPSTGWLRLSKCRLYNERSLCVVYMIKGLSFVEIVLPLLSGYLGPDSYHGVRRLCLQECVFWVEYKISFLVCLSSDTTSLFQSGNGRSISVVQAKA